VGDRNLHLVFSKPPEGVSDEEFNRWYDAHLLEILAVPGFRAARRFRLEGVVNPDVSPAFRYLVVYELDGDPEAAMAALEQANLGSAELYTELKAGDEGLLPLPPWFGDVLFASWNCYSLGEDT
jgi:hypothetical protein